MTKAIMAVKFADKEDSSIEPIILKYRGEIVAKTGDGLIAEFARPAKALECAGQINEASGAQPHRVGIHMGEANAGAAAQAVKLAGASAAGCAAISREVLDAARRIRGGVATSIGRQDFGIAGPIEVLHVFRSKSSEASGGHSKLLAPLMAALISLVLIGGYALWKKPSLMQMTLGIVTAPADEGPGARSSTPGFQQAPQQ
jgi:hypothetical protein